MSTAIARNFQIGIDPTPTNNFTLYQPATPDGTLRLGNGNTGITSSLLTLSSAGQLSFVAGSAAAPTLSPSGDSNTGIFFPAADTIAFAEGGVEAMRLDAAGNLGLGVTPSAWSGFGKTMEFNNAGCYVGNSGATSMQVGANNYFNGSNYIYSTSNVATRYAQASGQHQFFTAPSGTAGNAISFTQAMTLDASGNLGVGTTGIGTRLDVRGTSNTASSTIQIVGNGVSSLLLGQNSAGGVIRGQGGSDVLSFWTGGSGDTGAGQSGTERARIDSSGNLLVGTTTFGGDGGLSIDPKNPSTEGSPALVVWNKGNTASETAAEFRRNGSAVGSITYTGTAVAYNTSSDYRLKENIQPMTGALAKVAALKPCTYKWKVDGSDGEGFIAHELAEVVPQCVTGEKDAMDADGNPQYQGIDTSFLVATLTAAIQELKAEFDAYKATHP